MVALALIVLGWLAVRHGPASGLRLALALARPAPRRWLAVGATAVVVLAALPLGAAVTKYQEEKLFDRPPALALERMVGPKGAAVAYVGLNKPYTFFGSRLQNDVRIVPRSRRLEDQYYEWGGTVDFPYEEAGYVRWRRRLDSLDVEYVVVHRSPWEDPERDWMEGRPRAFRLVFYDEETEVWRVVSPEDLWKQRKREERGEDPLSARARSSRPGTDAWIRKRFQLVRTMNSGGQADRVGDPADAQGCGGGEKEGEGGAPPQAPPAGDQHQGRRPPEESPAVEARPSASGPRRRCAGRG